MTDRSPLRVAVFGATGLLGRAALERFRRDGHKVTALVRDDRHTGLPDDVTLIRGDITDQDAVAAALDLADVAHISVSGGHEPAQIRRVEVDGVRHVAEQAATLGLSRVTMISGIFATPEHAAHHPGEAAKLKAEQLLLDTTPATIFRPGFFADTLQRFVQRGNGMLLGAQPRPLRPLVADDLMAEISRSYEMESTLGHRYDTVGTEPMLLRDALARYLAATMPKARIRTMPLPVARIMNRVMLRGTLTRTLDTMTLLQNHGDASDPQPFYETFGMPATSFSAWLDRQTARSQGTPFQEGKTA